MSGVTIDGVIATPLRQIVDERGAVMHMLRATDPAFAGLVKFIFRPFITEK